ncbi:MAG: hypothetical protein NTY19_21785 [Planctomycetota bacterium]|nr:hypothetical protein [Planctomycetota bacterium]
MPQMLDLKTAIARFGADAKAKLANPAASGEPEDQLRAPLERLFADLVELCGFQRELFTAVGESLLPTLKTRPDYAITLRKVLVGYVEVKAPAKAPTHAATKGTTRNNGKSSNPFPTFSIPTATRSVFGKTANSSAPSSNWRAM